MKIVKLLCLLGIFAITGCETTGSGTGPDYGGKNNTSNKIPVNIEPMSVSIAVFDPGLPEDTDDYYSETSWPELRRAESIEMAQNLKKSMEATNNFGAVRVTPSSTASSDLYVEGRIVESNGEDVKVKITVSDSTGKKWINNKTYKHRVTEYVFQEPRFRDTGGELTVDPYDEIYEKITKDIQKLRISGKVANKVKLITDLRFAQNMASDSYSDILKERNGRYSLKGAPAENDPMMERVKSVQYREQMFVDSLQPHYEAFSSNMDKSYSIWQQQAFVESKNAREQKEKANAQAFAAILLAAATVAITGEIDDPDWATATAVTGALATIAVFNESFKSSDEAEIHRDALNELGASVDSNLAPFVIEMEETTTELTGNADEQFDQLREILKKIYTQENQVTNTINNVNVDSPPISITKSTPPFDNAEASKCSDDTDVTTYLECIEALR